MTDAELHNFVLDVIREVNPQDMLAFHVGVADDERRAKEYVAEVVNRQLTKWRSVKWGATPVQGRDATAGEVPFEGRVEGDNVVIPYFAWRMIVKEISSEFPCLRANIADGTCRHRGLCVTEYCATCYAEAVSEKLFPKYSPPASSLPPKNVGNGVGGEL